MFFFFFQGENIDAKHLGRDQISSIYIFVIFSFTATLARKAWGLIAIIQMLALQKIFVNKYVPFPYISGWFEATQAFETLGFIVAIFALVLIVLYVFVPQTSDKKIVFILAMLACFAAGKV
jgi:hypothetical protein